MTSETLKYICDLTVELTRLRQNECKHLCIEEFAPTLLRNLLTQFNESTPKEWEGAKRE